MSNQNLSNHLETLANYYMLASDFGRTRAFRSAAQNINLVNFTIDKNNIQNVTFKGLGESVVKVIHEYIETQSSSRYEELRLRYPPPSSIEMLSLFNFDLQYVKHLWETYKASSIQDLKTIKEARVRQALSYNTFVQETSFAEGSYKLLGDCAVHTTYSIGKHSIDEITEKLKSVEDKHIFIADYIEGPNTIGSCSIQRFLTQKESIKQAQIKHNIRIWQGVILDIDIDGEIRNYQDTEYVILKPTTSPHTNVLSRLEKALKKLGPKSNIMIDFLDKYSLHLNASEFLSLIKTYNPILLLHCENSFAASQLYHFLLPISKQLPRIALASYAKNEDDLALFDLVVSLANKLDIQEKHIINCLPKPFGLNVSANKIGVR